MEARGDGETAGARADDEDVEEVGEGCHCACVSCIVGLDAFEVVKRYFIKTCMWTCMLYMASY